MHLQGINIGIDQGDSIYLRLMDQPHLRCPFNVPNSVKDHSPKLSEYNSPGCTNRTSILAPILKRYNIGNGDLNELDNCATTDPLDTSGKDQPDDRFACTTQC